MSDKKRELLFSVTRKDFRRDTFRAGGKGGQKQNKTDSGVRFTHIESGAVGESREERSQHQNEKIAFRRCVESPKFQSWHKRKVAELTLDRQTLEKRIKSSLSSTNVKVEVADGKGGWITEGGAEQSEQ